MKDWLTKYFDKKLDGREQKELTHFKIIYFLAAVIACISLCAVLFETVCNLPAFGEADNPVNNEVPERYVEQGIEETGAVNAVAGMILDYRAFDTFGESCVLFTATCCVTVLLKIQDNKIEKKKNEYEHEHEHLFEPRNDKILQGIAKILIPILMLFGVYVILNGHISPGGGFSGGTILGAAMILYHIAFGSVKAESVLTEKRIKAFTVAALTFYCLAKSYSFFTGANHLESHIPLGTPGNIISSGLILPLNICVGIVVGCTMYSFYVLFKRGSL